ncbi:MAG: elongation factor Ts [Chlamydiia bacterium]|nr:elongation factor Ts [Chlamydiia bacterium]
MTQITAQLIKELRDRTGIGMGKCKEALVEASGDIELAISNLRKAGMASAGKKEGRATNEGKIASAEQNGCIALAEVNAETDFVVRNDRFQQFTQEIADEVASSNPADLEKFMSQPFSKDSSLTVDQYRSTVVQTIGENIQIRRFECLSKDAQSSYGVYSHMGGQIVCLVEIAGSNEEEELAREIAMHVAAAHPEFLNPEEVPNDVLENEKDIVRNQLKGKPSEVMEKIILGKLNAYYEQNCLIKQKFIKDDKVTIEQLIEKRAKESGKQLRLKRFLRWNVGG